MEKPQPYCTRYVPFRAEEAERMLREAEDTDPLVISTPPIKPKGGDVFIYSSKAAYKGKPLSELKNLHCV